MNIKTLEEVDKVIYPTKNPIRVVESFAAIGSSKPKISTAKKNQISWS